MIVEKVYSADNTVDKISAGDSSEIFHSSLKHFQSKLRSLLLEVVFPDNELVFLRLKFRDGILDGF